MTHSLGQNIAIDALEAACAGRFVCEDLFSGLSYETDAGRPLSVTLPPDSATILHYSEIAAKGRK